MRRQGIYAITSEELSPPDIFLQHVEQALLGGVAAVQYRNKTADQHLRLEQARALVALCRRYETPLLINDDVSLCLAVGADGVHLGQQDGDCARTRSCLGPDAIIGVTCHDSLERASRAQEQGASYVAFGRFFPSRTKPEAPAAAIQVLAQARQVLRIPIVAIGGITTENGAQLITAGADLLAVIHDLFGARDITAKACALRALFHSDTEVHHA
ncbi:MAG: thiamine phosphate synthase [Pseudomonadales bacterium]|nr:thiamine phosphate synthase [Pseudomonadales bacterium]